VLINERTLNRATLARQLLLERSPLPVADAVRHLVGLQAQAPASPYLALWNRLSGFAAADLDQAFSEGTVVKATLLRITLHAAHAADYPVLHDAVRGVLRAARLGDARFTRAGLTIAEVDEFLPELIAFTAVPRTVAEIEAMLADRFGGERPGLWWALRTFAPLHHVPTAGPWMFGSREFRAASSGPVPVLTDPSRSAAVQELVRRYLTAFGPATAADIRQFTLLPGALIRQALDGSFERWGDLYDVPGGELPPADVPAPPRLLGMWDNMLLAYADRSRVIPPEYRRAVIRVNGDVLPCVLVDGYVAGVWRTVPSGVEVTAFRELPLTVWDQLASEAAALSAVLADRDPLVYVRYAHWWSKPLPAAQTRILPP
jgi:hypothetical protein